MKIPKKGALNNRNNWRGITLLSVLSDILAKIIIQRIANTVVQQLRREQAGFRKESDAQTRSSPYVTSYSSAQSGRDNSTSTLWTLRRLLTVYTGKVCGASFGPMRYHSR